MLRMVSSTLEERLRQRFSRVHVGARVAQIDEVIGRARGHADALRAAFERLRAALAGRIWLPPDLAQRMRADAEANVAMLQALVVRLDAVRAGFAALPVDDAAPADAAAPEPVAIGG